MEPEPGGGSGWVRRKKDVNDPAQIALDSEARAYWRSLDPAKFQKLYRDWVIARPT
jgi:hypothetical protein